MSLLDFREYGNSAEVLFRAIGSGHVSHAYIIEGDHTVNKTGFAKAFAKALLCEVKPGEGCDNCPTCRKLDSGSYEDLYVLEPDGNAAKGTLSVKDQAVEELQGNLAMKPTGGPRNIAILAGADYMTVRAQNRFLKTLEEPPTGTVICLLSENSENLLATIRSRCVTLRLMDFQEVPTSEKGKLAEEVLEMLSRKSFFYDMRELLDKNLKERIDAYEFLDALEGALGRMMRSGGGAFPRNQIAGDVALIENARRKIRQNVNYKYVIRNLLLKLEENE